MSADATITSADSGMELRYKDGNLAWVNKEEALRMNVALARAALRKSEEELAEYLGTSCPQEN